MLPKILNPNTYIPFLLAVYAFLINWFSGNMGVMPIDTFGFFDTGFSILKNKFPIRDFWIFIWTIMEKLYFSFIFFKYFGNFKFLLFFKKF